jgi:hypothetical protein
VREKEPAPPMQGEASFEESLLFCSNAGVARIQEHIR